MGNTVMNLVPSFVKPNKRRRKSPFSIRLKRIKMIRVNKFIRKFLCDKSWSGNGIKSECGNAILRIAKWNDLHFNATIVRKFTLINKLFCKLIKVALKLFLQIGKIALCQLT